MPFAEISTGKIHYELQGPQSAPTILFSNSLGAALAMWEPQNAALSAAFRVLRYDTRGHGESTIPPGPYKLSDLGKDVVELLDALKIERAHFCGISMGGMIALWLGVNCSDRFDKFVVCNTAARVGTAEAWDKRMATVQTGGMPAISPALLERWFTAQFRDRQPETLEKIRAGVLGTPVEGYLACCAAMRDADLREQVARIKNRTLVISGAHDSVASPAEGKLLAGKIPAARYVELNAAHLSNIEAASDFNNVLLQFLS